MKITKTERKLIAAVGELQMECSARKENTKMLGKVIKLAEKAIEELMEENYKLKKQVNELTPKEPEFEQDKPGAEQSQDKPAAKTTVKKVAVRKDGTPKRKPGPPKKTETTVVQPELPLVDGTDVSPGAEPDFLKAEPNGENQ